MTKTNNESRATALLFSFSAVVLVLLSRAVLLQPPDRRPALADLALAALDRFLDGRGLLDLATRRNMVLLCHAILLVILRDAGVIGAPARRRATTATASTDDSAVVASIAAAPVLTDSADPEGTIVLWQQQQQPPRDGAKQDAPHHADGSSGRRPVRRRQPRRSAQAHPAAAAAAPIRFAAAALAAERTEQHQAPDLTSKEIVLVEEVRPRNYNYLLLDDHDDHAAAAVVEVELPSATCWAADGKKNNLGRRAVVAPGDAGSVTSEQTEETPELADDRRIEEFIAKQWSTIRHESMQLDRSLGSQPKSRAIIAAW